MQLLSEAVVAIDGSKFKAVNNRDRNSPSRKSSRGWHTWRRQLGNIWTTWRSARV